MALITLTTDFGLSDEYAGVMKGAILKVNPDVTIVDITHQIPPFNAAAATRTLMASYPYFPDNSVHVVVVDPGVGSERNIIAIDMDDHLFLVPDNGIPWFLTTGRTVSKMVRVERYNREEDRKSGTFHGRDIFAPIAARLAGGLDPYKLGPAVKHEDLVRMIVKTVTFSEKDRSITGRIVSIDHFGNLITDIEQSDLHAHFGEFNNRSIEINVGDHIITGLCHHYSEAAQNTPLIVIGSRGYLEISVNQGSAKDLLSTGLNTPVSVSLNAKSADMFINL